jgi:hypothetical protein
VRSIAGTPGWGSATIAAARRVRGKFMCEEVSTNSLTPVVQLRRTQ